MLHFTTAIFMLTATAHAKILHFVNRQNETIWIGSQGNAGLPSIEGGGWKMPAGSNVSKRVPDNWAGRFWARTGCSFDAAGNGRCVVGDCGCGLKCNGSGGTPPFTQVEITLQGWRGRNYYDVSNFDGFNVPASITPTDKTGSGKNCTSAYCNTDINAICPVELQVVSNGRVVACRTCRGANNTQATCQQSINYLKFWKDACPQAINHAHDDVNNVFVCSNNTNYRIVFGN